jgi:hypothetical protein
MMGEERREEEGSYMEDPLAPSYPSILSASYHKCIHSAQPIAPSFLSNKTTQLIEAKTMTSRIICPSINEPIVTPR